MNLRHVSKINSMGLTSEFFIFVNTLRVESNIKSGHPKLLSLVVHNLVFFSFAMDLFLQKLSYFSENSDNFFKNNYHFGKNSCFGKNCYHFGNNNCYPELER